MRFRIIPPVGNTRSPLNVETLLNSLHKSLRSASTVSLFLESEGGRVGYAAEVPDEQRIVFIQELQDAYPGTLVKVQEREPESSDRQVGHASLRVRPDLLAIRTYDQFVDFADDRLLADPVAGLLASIRSGQSGMVMTPKWCSGRGGTRNFYYACNRMNRSVKTECDARYLPADTVENFVVDQISAWAKDRPELELAVQAASKFRGEEVGAITSELNAVRAQLREKQNALGNLMSAIEAGADYKTLADRINTLEQDKSAVEERINRLELERADRENQSLSTEVVAETYCDFPFIVNRLKETGDLHGLRDLLRCYIAAIDVHQEEDDPSSGHMEIMLFEEEIPSWVATAHQKTLAERLELRACESAPRNQRSPERVSLWETV